MTIHSTDISTDQLIEKAGAVVDKQKARDEEEARKKGQPHRDKSHFTFSCELPLLSWQAQTLGSVMAYRLSGVYIDLMITHAKRKESAEVAIETWKNTQTVLQTLVNRLKTTCEGLSSLPSDSEGFYSRPRHIPVRVPSQTLLPVIKDLLMYYDRLVQDCDWRWAQETITRLEHEITLRRWVDDILEFLKDAESHVKGVEEEVRKRQTETHQHMIEAQTLNLGDKKTTDAKATETEKADANDKTKVVAGVTKKAPGDDGPEVVMTEKEKEKDKPKSPTKMPTTKTTDAA